MSTDDKTPEGAPGEGERIAKVLSRAGVASRRDAERMILEGRVTVNGAKVTSPATNVTDKDRLAVDGQPVGEAEATRVWLYHKPAGLVTTEHDEEGRPTVFDSLPEDMPRVMSVGRLDLTSEGLLLLTNDGEIKRKLELPSTGWSRRYRVRIHGTPTKEQLEPLRQGITVDDMDYQPMEVSIDRQQGANAWLTITLREGKNREIRRAMEHLGFTVNRLIRISYGPFQLGDLPVGDVEEVRPKIVRDQLGLSKPEAVTRARKRPSPDDMPVFDDEPEDRPARDRLSTARPAGATVKRELKARGPRSRDAGDDDTRSRPTRSPRKVAAPSAFSKPRTWMRTDEARAAREDAGQADERPHRGSGEGSRSSGFKSHGRPPRAEGGGDRSRSSGFRSHAAEGGRSRSDREEGDGPRKSFRDRGPRADGDRGPRKFGDDDRRPPRRSDDERPPRRFEGNDRPRGPRPARDADEARPARAYKPRTPREGTDERSPRPFKPSRPAREGDEGRSAKYARAPRPQREGEERRPPRRFEGQDGRPDRGFKPQRQDRGQDSRPPRSDRPSREGDERRPFRADRNDGPRGPREGRNDGERSFRKGPREGGPKGRPSGDRPFKPKPRKD
ncbi:pseudouridine synthase [Rubellimicrobium arenae]|uniref:pseudouridine synthase n=1 Tax=Rubellimicrobium arenae TaxID=2817372 RepID=UPI001B300ED5|nr:pseudouridine synthase [Rubellimicrobium arenae]